MSNSLPANVRARTCFFETLDTSPWMANWPSRQDLTRLSIKRPVGRTASTSAHYVTEVPVPARPHVSGLEEELSFELAPLADALNQSRWMLDLEDDWDGEDSAGYAEATWERAARYVIDSAKFVHELGLNMPIPKVQNGPEGTIDLFWETLSAKLLLNIPIEIEKPAQFYGHKSDGSEIRGPVDTAQIQPWLMLWTAEPTHK